MKGLKFIAAFLVLACAHIVQVHATTCYTARLEVTLPPEAVGANLFMNVYYFNGDGVKTHVVTVLTQGQPKAEYAVRWSGTWEVDLTMPGGEIIGSQIALPNGGQCYSAINAPLFNLDLAD